MVHVAIVVEQAPVETPQLHTVNGSKSLAFKIGVTIAAPDTNFLLSQFTRLNGTIAGESCRAVVIIAGSSDAGALVGTVLIRAAGGRIGAELTGSGAMGSEAQVFKTLKALAALISVNSAHFNRWIFSIYRIKPDGCCLGSAKFAYVVGFTPYG